MSETSRNTLRPILAFSAIVEVGTGLALIIDTGVLYVDGQEVAKNSMGHTAPITLPEDETFDIGEDTRSPLALIEYRYDTPFKFTGKIDKLTFNLEPQ